MSKKIGDHVKIVKDGTGEFLNCIGEIVVIKKQWDDEDTPIGVAFGKADNTVPLEETGFWGAWFHLTELRRTKRDISPIGPIPI